MTETFGEYLKRKRREKGFQVNQFALYSGVSAGQISRIENNSRGIPKPETIKKLANGLNLPYEELMARAGYFDEEPVKAPAEPKEKPAELTEFLKNANVMFHGELMSAEDKRIVEDVLTGLFLNSKERRKKDQEK